MTISQKNIFIEKLTNTITNRELIKLTLISKRDKSSDLKTVIITAVDLKKGYSLNFIYRHNTKDITKNYPVSEGIALISKALDADFFNADIFANNENVSFITTPEGKVRIKTQKPTLQPIKLLHTIE